MDKEKLQKLVKKTKELKILYVEDNEEARTQMLKMLKNFFSSIEIAIDGEDGLEKYQQGQFDIVLTDINMPKLNGIDMIKQILQIDSNQKVIILSAYNDSEYLHECINIGIKYYLIKPISFDRIIQSLENITKNISMKKENEELNRQIQEILQYSEDGYLLFNSDLKCLKTYSKKCLDIFQVKSIDGKKICELLFQNNIYDSSLFKEGIENILSSKDNISKELFLSLLPQETFINNRYVKITFKILENKRFMAILEDITEKKRLESQLEKNSKILKMLVAITSNLDDFLKLKEEYESFLDNPPKSFGKMFRILHTFKGNFAQKHLLNTPQTIHEYESILKNNSILEKQYIENLKKSFDKDIEIFKKFYGEKYLVNKNLIFIRDEDIKKIDKMLLNLSTTKNNLQEKIREIRFYVSKLRYVKIYELLTYYTTYIEHKSNELSKLILPLEIQGDKELTGMPKLRPFFKSLVHLFNNCIDHGIEDSNMRIKIGKDEYGKIECSYQKIQNTLLLEISDDGKGIDKQKLLQKAIEKGVLSNEDSKKLKDNEIYQLIFTEFISTKDNSDITSGRGVGMSAVKYELDKIDGKVLIDSETNKGTKFKFFLPIDESFNITEKYELDILNQLSNQLLNVFDYEISIKDERFLDDLPIEELLEHNELDIIGKKSFKCVVSYSNTILHALIQKLFGENISKDEINELKDELSKEVTNIIVGLSLGDFSKNFGEVNMSIPLKVLTMEFKKLLDMRNNRYIKAISTSKGNIYFTLIENKTDKSLKNKKITEEIC